MQKKELIWREILDKCFEEGVLVFTQKENAQRLKVSLSTVNNALKLPRASGAIEVTGKNFRIKDKEKFLLLWASHRKLGKDIVYQTNVGASASEIEGRMPPGISYGAYSAFVKKYKTAPADYGAVYIYAEKEMLSEIKKRFISQKGTPNLFVLKADPMLKNYGELTPDVQTFVDLWNLPQWYAKDFLNELRKKMRLNPESGSG